MCVKTGQRKYGIHGFAPYYNVIVTMVKRDVFAKKHFQYSSVFALVVITPIATALVTSRLQCCSYLF